MRPDRFHGLEPDLVRLLLPIAEEHFPEQIMALSWWKDNHRAAGLALLAFGAELFAIPAKVTDPTLGAVRFAFWREVIEEVQDGSARAHPVAQGLLSIKLSDQLPSTADLLSLIDGAEDRLPEIEGGAGGRDGDFLSVFLPLLARASGGTEDEACQLAALGRAADIANPDPHQDFAAIWRDFVPLPPAIAPVAAAGRLSFYNRLNGPKSLFRQRLSLLKIILFGR